MAQRNVLVVGATGKQGGSVVDELLKLPKSDSPLHILALTRNVESGHAKSLVEKNKGIVELVQGDSTQPEPIFANKPKGSIDELFIVTVPGKTDEEAQAIPLIDAAVEHGVKHIVFSSVDRGGEKKSWENPTNVKHFWQKHNIEIHLRDKAQKEGDKFTWTILRPAAFLDNLNPGFFCSVMTAMWKSRLSPETKLQMVSTRDIGRFAALALNDPTKWAGRAISLAGDELTLTETQEIFKQVEGKDLPQTFSLVGSAMMFMVKEMGAMFDFFEKEGYGADIGECKKEVPELQDFATWLKEESKWKDEK